MGEDAELHVLESMRALATELGAVRATLEAQNEARALADAARSKQERRRNRILGLAVAVSLLMCGGLVWVSIDNHISNAKLQRVIAQNQADIAASDRKWCPIVGAILNPGGAPSPTKRGQQIAALFEKLFEDYGCTTDDIPTLPPSS